MNTIFWTVFYIITALLIIGFLFFEKFVTDKLNNFSDKIYTKIDNKQTNLKLVYSVNIVNILVIIAMYIFFIDKTKSYIIPIKNYAVNITILANLSFLIINFRKDILFILNFVMYIAGLQIFGIDDVYFSTLMIVSMIFDLISIYFESEKLQKSIRLIINGMYVVLVIGIIQTFYLGNYVIPTQSMEPTILVKDRIFSNNIKYKYKSPKLNDIISFKEPLDNKLMYTKRITGVAGSVFELGKDNRIYSDGKMINDRYYSKGSGSIYSILDNQIYIPKKGDKVTIDKIIEYDINNNRIKFISPQEFKNNNSDADYKKIIGIYNFGQYDGEKRYSFIMKEKNHPHIMLPILDFKYDKATLDKMLDGEYITLDDDYYMAMGDNTDNSQDSRYFGYIKKSRIQGSLFFRWFPLNRIGIVKDEY